MKKNPAMFGAIGEVGLDYDMGTTSQQQQKEIFRGWLMLAKELGKNVQIHLRLFYHLICQ